MSAYITGGLPFDLQSLLGQEIDKGEQLRWLCQPSVRQAVKRSLPAVVFAVIWLAISLSVVFLVYSDTRKGKDVPLIAMGVAGLFVLIGFFLLTTPFWAARRAKNTVYAITDKRAIIITKKGSAAEILSFGEDKLKSIDKRVLIDGSGDLIFERQVSYHQSKGRTRQQVKEIGFFGIPQVNQVEDLLAEIKQG
jgi:hypothetical protein